MPEPSTKLREADIRFRCECGAGLRIATRYIGQVKHCPKCQTTFTVPSAESSKAKVSSRRTPQASLSPSLDSPSDSSVVTEATCAVCQCSLLPDDERTLCPACGLPHHTDCWNENFGCSAYGCSQVNVLKPGPDLQIGSGMLNTHTPLQRSAPPLVPTSFSFSNETTSLAEFAILVGSVVGFLLGVVTYGVPCFLAGAGIVAFVFAHEGRVNWKAVVPAGLICVFGFVIGIIGSSHLYGP